MKCKEFEELIPLYIDDIMDTEDVKAFIEHVDSCPVCRDELEVNYLVREGLNRLEDGQSFSLKEELDRKLAKSRRFIAISVRGRMALAISGIVLGAILVAVILGVIIL